MTDFRNLTREAMDMAKRDFLALNPQLATKEARIKLDPIDKYLIFKHLVANTEFYEELLTQEVLQ